MKMVVGYVEHEAVEPIREDLLEHGFLSLSVIEASGTLAEGMVSGQYRGATIERHSRPKARLECVVGADHASTVIDTVLKHAPERSFVFAVAVEHVAPTDTVKLDEGGGSGE